MTSPVTARVVTSETAPARVPLAALAVAALLALPLAAVIGEAATAPVVADPGGFVRWGILYARLIHDLAAAATVGLLLHAAYLVPETTRTNRRVTATRLAGIAAGLWALAGAAGAVLTMANSIGIPLTDPAFGQQFAERVRQMVRRECDRRCERRVVFGQAHEARQVRMPGFEVGERLLAKAGIDEGRRQLARAIGAEC